MKKKKQPARRTKKPAAGKLRLSAFDDPKVKWISKGVDPKGATIMYLKDGKLVSRRVPLRHGVRKASKKEAREFMRMAREGFGLITINPKRKKRA